MNNESKVICDKCKGRKVQKDFVVLWIPGHGFVGGVSYKCVKCHGTGELDWIEKIVGKRGKIEYEFEDIKEIEFKDFPWKSMPVE